MRKGNGPYYVKIFFGAAVVYVLLDHASGTNAITGTMFSGLSNLQATAQGRAA